MARMPGADWLGAHHDNGTMSRWDVVCIHTIGGGNPPAHAAHFSVRSDGWIYQSRDTAYRSSANADGNHRIIAIENDDLGPEYGSWDPNNGHAVPPFTAAQIEANAKICAWVYATHGIPLVPCPNSLPSSRGVGYHRQGIDGNWTGYTYGGRVPGGELWSTARGKVCPGDRRIAQISRIIDRARRFVGLPGGFLMALSDDQQQQIYDVINQVAKRLPGKNLGDVLADLWQWLQHDPVNKAYGPVANAAVSTNMVLTQNTQYGPAGMAMLREILAEVAEVRSTPPNVEIDYDRIIDGVVRRLRDDRHDHHDRHDHGHDRHDRGHDRHDHDRHGRHDHDRHDRGRDRDRNDRDRDDRDDRDD